MITEQTSEKEILIKALQSLILGLDDQKDGLVFWENDEELEKHNEFYDNQIFIVRKLLRKMELKDV